MVTNLRSLLIPRLRSVLQQKGCYFSSNAGTNSDIIDQKLEHLGKMCNDLTLKPLVQHFYTLILHVTPTILHVNVEHPLYDTKTRYPWVSLQL